MLNMSIVSVCIPTNKWHTNIMQNSGIITGHWRDLRSIRGFIDYHINKIGLKSTNLRETCKNTFMVICCNTHF